MSDNPTAAPERPAVRLKIRPSMVLALRLTVRNRMVAAALIRPAIDNWVVDDGQILSTDSRLEPAYVYLLQGAEARLTVTMFVPAHLQPGQILRSALQFPGVQETGVPIELEILPPLEEEPRGRLLEHYVTVTLPLDGDSEGTNGGGGAAVAARATYSLVAGLAGLDMIPARWLVAELLAIVAQSGAEYAETDEGGKLLIGLGGTRFFKNGVLALSSAQAPQWIVSGLSSSSGLHAALGGQVGQGRILYIWERWLLNLIDTDVENTGGADQDVRTPPPALDRAVSQLGTDADRWFGNIVLGLAKLSPRFLDILKTVAAAAPSRPAGNADGPPPPGDILGEEGSIQR